MKNTKSNKNRPVSRCAARGAGIAVAAIMAVSGGSAFAAPFLIPGNLVVERIGNGTETLTTAGNTIFFDAYTTAASQSSPVATVTIPDGTTYLGANPMIDEGSFSTSSSTGGISLTANGQTLCFGGYATTQPYSTSLNSSTSTAVPRAIGTVNAQGVYTQDVTSTVFGSTYSIQSVTTDGAGNYWGTTSGSTATTGEYYFGTGTPASVYPHSGRAITIANGSLWYNSGTSSGGATYGIFAFSGDPTTASTPTLQAPLGANDSDYALVVNPAGTVIYDADDGHYSATNAGIWKWTYNGTSWSRAYNLLNNGTSGTSCFGLAVNWNTPGGPTLYATTGDDVSANNLIAVQDAGSGNQTPIVLATAATKTIFRGVVFVPTFTPGALAVERLGDGTETLSTTGNTIFIDQYATNGTAQSPSLTVTIPDGSGYPGFPYTGATPLIEEGTGGTSGSMTLSPDGLILSFDGYATNQPYSGSLSTPTAAVVNRDIGTVNANGFYTLAAKSTTAFSTDTTRGATTDDEGNFWAVSSGGLYYYGNGTPASFDTYTTRSVHIFNNNLWFIAESGSAPAGYGIYEYSGLPTTAQTPTKIIPLSSTYDSDYNFAVNPAFTDTPFGSVAVGTVIYETDDGGFQSYNSGVWKWTNNSGTWVRAYNLLGNGSTGTPCFGLAVNWAPAGGPVLYATTGSGTAANELITFQDTGVSNVTPTVLATAAAKTSFRGVTFAPTNAGAPTPPTFVSITPASQTVTAGSTAEIAVAATGTPPLQYFWYHGAVNPSDLIAGATTSTLTLSNILAASAGSYYAVISNSSGSTATSTASTVTVIDPAFVSTPASVEGLLGGQLTFAATVAGTGMTYQWWYSDANGDMIATIPNGTLSHGTFISGASGSLGTSADASIALVLTNLQVADFTSLPTNLLLVVTGTDGTTNDLVSLYSIGSTGSGSGEGDGAQVDGQGAGYGAILAFWNFNGPAFNFNAPPPWFGSGTASLVNMVSYDTTVQDPYDGADSPFPYGINVPPLTNNSWGTSPYPAAGGGNSITNLTYISNKMCGIQFMVSTLGAQGIVVSYDARVSATASDYERLQYTTTGTNGPWIDYPSSMTFGGHSGTGNGGFEPYAFSLAGFSNVDNNPNFGIRIVSEAQSTATYGAGVAGVISNNYVGTANTYGTGGTMTFDIVAFYGDYIDLATYSPPTITGTTNQTNLDSVLITNNFTVSGAYPPFTVSAESLNPNTVSPQFAYSGTSPNFTIVMTPNPIPDAFDAAPILVTATDANGNTVVTWFDLFLTTQFPAPTNSLTTLGATNMLPNKSLSIPFKVGSSSQPIGNLTYGVSSDNNTLVPSGNIVVSGTGTSTPTVTITPAPDQAGMAQVSVTVYDNNPTYPPTGKATTATFSLIVRPNTNVVMADYFDYDASQQSLDEIPDGYWTHLSGINHQMQVYGNGNGDFVTVDSVNNTENLQAPLIGGPFSDSAAGSLYSSFTVNMSQSALPVGSYAGFFLTYNDNTDVTGDYECAVTALTNTVVLNDGNHYRLAIQNWPGGNGTEDNSHIKIFPQDLVAGQTYVVVTELVLSNGFSTLWVEPTNGPSSTSVADTTSASAAGATLFNIGAIELRESSSEDTDENPGIIDVGELKVGRTFDSVYPSLQIVSALPNVILNWSDPTLGIQSATSVSGPWTDVSLTPGLQPPYTNNTTTNDLYFRFGH